ncbi:hypothetical protein MCHI_000323 [Candidatus Magnetoovum chiemensis]|nr:hypothetical protein MCHI_000323 [Candidatus Magnetoovum chiemensis]
MILHKAKKGTQQEIDDDSKGDYCYRLATDKTRYKPCEIFLDFCPEGKGFVTVDNPKNDVYKQIQEIMIEYKETGLTQTKMIEICKNELSIGKNKVKDILNKGIDKYWIIEKGNRNSTAYRPIS